MKKTMIVAACGMMLLLASCGGKQAKIENTNTTPVEERQLLKKIPYTIAEHYFFRNDAQVPTNPKINTREAFDSLFGMAAVMGDNGAPTSIDFEKQFVIAVVLPVTNQTVDLSDKVLIDDGKTLTFEYTAQRHEETNSYESRPIMLVVVDRQYERDQVTLSENG